MKRRKKQRVISFLLTICMMLAMTNGFSAVTYAATALDVSTNSVDITESGYYTITGSTSTNTIKVEPNVPGVNITLSNVSIDVSSNDDACAFDIGDGAIVNVILADGTTNTFKSGASKAGVKVEALGKTAGSITIDGIGTGTLIAVGGKGDSDKGFGSGSGIGSNGIIVGSTDANTVPDSGNIIINNGTIQATGGVGACYSGSGIGGGGGYDSTNGTYASNGGNTTIHGGNVTAIGGSATSQFSGTGIGGGAGYYSGNGGTIIIDGGNVTAQSGNGRSVSSAIGNGNSNAYVRDGKTSITIKDAVVNASTPAANRKYPTLYSSNITIVGNTVLKASNDTGNSSLNLGGVIFCDNLKITGSPEITALASTKTYGGTPVSAIYAGSTSLEVPIISGIFASPLSTTTDTDIVVSGGNSTNTKTITMPANYTSFATTVNSIGRYTGSSGTNVLQDTTVPTKPANIFNLINKINQYNLTLVSGPVDQEAPTGLAGTAPTTDANNDGKITGTTIAMEYKLASAEDTTYKACSNTETTGLAAGDYLVRYAAKTGFNAGATTAVTVSQYVDNIPPVINSVTGNPLNWTNDSVTLTVSATDAGSGLAAKAYSFDGGTNWQEGNAKTYDTNTSGIVIKVKDKAGNIASYDSIDITKIDKTAPTNAKITVGDKEFTSFLNTITFGLFFKNTVGITITPGSDVSEINKIEYQKVPDASKYDPSGTWTEGSSLSVNPDEKFIVYAKITDNAGNYVIINSDGAIVDATQPALEVTPDSGDWIKDNVKVTVSDNLSGVKEVSYTTDEAVPQSGTVAITSGEGTITLTNEGQYKLTVTAKDNSLNEITKTVDIKLDKSIPLINSVTGNPSDLTSDSVTLTVNATDAKSGLAAQAYSFDGGTNWQSANTKTYDTNTNGIVIKAKDNAGNIATYDSINITKINKTAPGTAVIKDAANYTDSKWFNKTQTITASFTETNGCGEKLQYKVDNSAWTDGESVDVSAEGKHVVNFRVIDTLGRTSEVQTVNVNIDATQPALEVTPDTGDWIKDIVKVKVSDNLSGVKEATYTTDEMVPQSGTVEITNGEGTITLSNEGQYKLTVTAKDNSLNEITKTVDIKLDKSMPVINSVTGNPSDWTSDSVTLTVDANDAGSGLAAQAYSFDGGTTWQSENTKTYDANTNGIVIKVKDNAGNIAAYDPIDITKIDKTAPTNAKITVEDKEFTSFLNTITFGLFFKNTVGVKITADSDTSGINKIEYQKVSDASNYKPGGTWTEGSSLSVNPDEKFIVYAKITDNAGNYAIINSDGVVVDATQPALEVTPDTSDWTKDNVNVKVKVSDNLSGVKEATYATDETVSQSGTVEITNGEGTITLSNEGQYKLTVTAKDNSLNEITKTVDIKLDKGVPVINSVTGNPSDWTKDSVTLTVDAKDAASGLAAQAYSFDGGTTWQSGNTRTYDANTNGIVIKVKDNVGNIAAYDPINITKIDKTAPGTAVIKDAANYTDSKWFNESQTITANLTKTSGCDEKLQYKVDDSAWTDGESVCVSTEGKHIISFRVIDALGRTSEVQTVNVNIDETLALITGVSDSSSYFIGRIIKINDKLSEIASATYKNGTGTETSFKDGDLFEKAGKYTLILKDKAGNSRTLSFEIKALPSLSDVVYTTDCKKLIDSIRSEFNSHNDLPEPYKTNINNEIKALEDRYAQLDNEVIKIKAETSAIKAKVDKLPNGVDGLLNLQKEIQDEYNIIAGNASILTEEQKKALAWEAEYLKQQLNIIATLQNQINGIKTQVSNIDTKDDGLISQEGKIIGILSDIGKLTNEQQIILKPQSDLLNSLLNKINTLKTQVNTVKGMINSLPSPDKITRQDTGNVDNIYKSYNVFTNEQKELLGEDLIKKLGNIAEVLRKLILHDANTDTTVIGVDGTSFASNVYIVVMPIKEDDLASKSAENASKNIFIVEGKELVALYDISLLKDGIKIQPDGKVKVKIRIPEELRGRIGLDIAHIADNGTVTPMNATVEGDYLVFTTAHFSEYAIVARPIAKELPKTGSIFDFDSLIFVGLLLSFIGIFLIRKKEERADKA